MDLINARFTVAPFVGDASSLKKTQFTPVARALSWCTFCVSRVARADFVSGIEIIMI